MTLSGKVQGKVINVSVLGSVFMRCMPLLILCAVQRIRDFYLSSCFFCMDGQGTSAYEQNTQQSWANGLSMTWHDVHL